MTVQIDGSFFHKKVILLIEGTQRFENQFVFRCVLIVGINDVKQKRWLTSILLRLGKKSIKTLRFESEFLSTTMTYPKVLSESVWNKAKLIDLFDEIVDHILDGVRHL